MAITTQDGWIGAAKQRIEITKTQTQTAVAIMPTSVFDRAGSPGAGTLAAGNTANGVVPTDAVAGYPTINAFGGGNKGYLGGIEFTNSVPCRMELHDILYKLGAVNFGATTTPTSQPSYSSRVPGGTDFKSTEIWLEPVTGFSGNLTATVTYTNQDGTTGRSTGAQSLGFAPIVGRMIRMPLQAGDTGVQKIESVVLSGSTAGTLNVLVTRQLWAGRVNVANGGDYHDFMKTGAPEVFADSALALIVQPDSTSSGIPSVQFDIVNG